MEVEEIGVVLSRACHLRSKLTTCMLHRASAEEDDDTKDGDTCRWTQGGDSEAQSLIKIRDALQSLEQQLACLQALQRRQRLERETTLAELEESRRILIKKLKAYRGTDLEVIHETSAFAGESIEQRDSILLPPYGRHLTDSFASSVDDYSPPLPSALSVRRRNISARQPFVNGDEKQESEHDGDCDGREEIFKEGNNNGTAKSIANGIGHIIGATTKAVLIVASVITVFTLAHFEPKIRRSASLKVLDLFPKRTGIPPLKPEADMPKCPPGKILLIEDGQPKCFVKERVEVPFQSVIKVPDVSYGFG